MERVSVVAQELFHPAPHHPVMADRRAFRPPRSVLQAGPLSVILRKLPNKKLVNEKVLQIVILCIAVYGGGRPKKSIDTAIVARRVDQVSECNEDGALFVIAEGGRSCLGRTLDVVTLTVHRLSDTVNGILVISDTLNDIFVELIDNQLIDLPGPRIGLLSKQLNNLLLKFFGRFIRRFRGESFLDFSLFFVGRFFDKLPFAILKKR